MWKHGLIGLWCMTISLAAVYESFLYSSSSAPTDLADTFPVLTEHHSISSGLVTVPLIRKGQVDGYLMAEVSLTANDEAFLHRGYPVSVDLADQLMTVLRSGAPTVADADFTIQRLRDDLVAQMNQRLGMQVFYRALVQRLDYITPADMERMRDPSRNEMTVTPVIDKALLDVVPASANPQ